jgi:hypothetical protein
MPLAQAHVCAHQLVTRGSVVAKGGRPCGITRAWKSTTAAWPGDRLVGHLLVGALAVALVTMS